MVQPQVSVKSSLSSTLRSALNRALSSPAYNMQPATVSVSAGEEALLDRIEPQASTSAVAFENGQSHDAVHNVTAQSESPTKPSRSWGLAEYGIPCPSTDLLPDPAVEVGCYIF